MLESKLTEAFQRAIVRSTGSVPEDVNKLSDVERAERSEQTATSDSAERWANGTAVAYKGTARRSRGVELLHRPVVRTCNEAFPGSQSDS
jgi:hypothetical protein